MLLLILFEVGICTLYFVIDRHALQIKRTKN